MATTIICRLGKNKENKICQEWAGTWWFLILSFEGKGEVLGVAVANRRLALWRGRKPIQESLPRQACRVEGMNRLWRMKCTASVALREDSNPTAVTVSWADPRSTPFYLLDVGTNNPHCISQGTSWCFFLLSQFHFKCVLNCGINHFFSVISHGEKGLTEQARVFRFRLTAQPPTEKVLKPLVISEVF